MKLRADGADLLLAGARRAACCLLADVAGLIWMAWLLFSVEATADIQPTGAGGKIDFNRQIRPILSENCFQCHGPDPAERKGKLRLDIREEALKPTKSGAKAIVAGQPGQSELLARVTHLDADELMPPPKTGKKKLAREQVELLKRWVEQGAPYSVHWSYTKPLRPEVPAVKNSSWPRTAMDHFVLARLEREGLSPMPEADRSTLIRRVALDLTGLPPTLEEVDVFLLDQSADAYGKLVDRFLQKESYGEHWAQLWLDLARYADSAGYADDPLRSIWGFRDYVIDAFNHNKPFDQFTVEQIAGDLLPAPSEEQLMATAFHRNTMTNSEGGTNDEEFRNAAIVDRVNTTLAVWMGTSIACAQCHNHKYDPLSQEEYFRFFAFLNNTEDADRFDETPVLPFLTPVQKQRRRQLEEEISKFNQQLSTPTPELLVQMGTWEQSFPALISWQAANPTMAKYGREAVLAVQEDGRVVHKGRAVDTYTVELPLAGKQLSALRVEVLPPEGQMRAGEGSGAGKIMISRVSAVLVPPAAQSIGGRFVRVELPGKDKILSLAEVQIFGTKENIALRGEASQSSTDADGSAKLAIDGNTDGDFSNAHSTTHTKHSENPWWEVDLKSPQDIRRISIWNRTDGETSKRLSDFRVIVLNEKREVLWERKIKDTPMPNAEWAIDGSRSLQFTTAFADENGAGSDASAVLAETVEPNKKGWVVSASTGKTYSLTLLTDRTESFSETPKLVVTLRVISEGEPHPLVSFKLLTASEERLTPFAKTPGDVVRVLSTPTGSRNAQDLKEMTAHFVRFVAVGLQGERDRLAAASGELAAIKSNTVPVQREMASDKRRKTQIQFRGNFMSLGSEVTEGVPAAFHPLPEGVPRNRLTLAKWLMDENNPLTARVVANRVWEQLFGIGIVRTSEEFGSQGEVPSNQELLDWMATELVAQRWDLKRFVKLLVTSSAYRQTSKVTPELWERDPDNRLLARGPRFRLTAEMVRDQALFLGGLLSPKVCGPSVKPPRPNSGLSAAFGSSVDWKTSEGEDSFRRGLYTEWRRTSPYPSMSTFDAPNREVCTLRRNRTNTPLQALVALNDPVYFQAAQGLARRMIRSGSSAAERIRHGFRLCLARSPMEFEASRMRGLLDEAVASYGDDPQKAGKTVAFAAISNLPEKDPKELAAWTAVANMLLNLDETLMKR